MFACNHAPANRYEEVAELLAMYTPLDTLLNRTNYAGFTAAEEAAHNGHAGTAAALAAVIAARIAEETPALELAAAASETPAAPVGRSQSAPTTSNNTGTVMMVASQPRRRGSGDLSARVHRAAGAIEVQIAQLEASFAQEMVLINGAAFTSAGPRGAIGRASSAPATTTAPHSTPPTVDALHDGGDGDDVYTDSSDERQNAEQDYGYMGGGGEDEENEQSAKAAESGIRKTGKVRRTTASRAFYNGERQTAIDRRRNELPRAKGFYEAIGQPRSKQNSNSARMLKKQLGMKVHEVPMQTHLEYKFVHALDGESGGGNVSHKGATEFAKSFFGEVRKKAAMQFVGGVVGNASYYQESPSSVEALNVAGTEPYKAFMERRKKVRVHPRFAWHGTDQALHESIAKHGLLVPGGDGVSKFYAGKPRIGVAHGQVHGKGVRTCLYPHWCWNVIRLSDACACACVRYLLLLYTTKHC